MNIRSDHAMSGLLKWGERFHKVFYLRGNDAVKVRNTIYLSGLVAVDTQDNVVGPSTPTSLTVAHSSSASAK